MSDEQVSRRKEVGAQVRLVRQAMGITIDQAAEAAPMSPVTWRSIENGNKVKSFSYAGAERVLAWEAGSIEQYIVSGFSKIPGVDGAYERGAFRTDGLIDAVLQLDRADATKVALIKVTRAGGAPIDAILALELPDAEKVELIGALREAQSLAGGGSEPAGQPSRAESA